VKKRKTKKREEIIKKSASLVWIAKSIYDFQLFNYLIGDVFVDELYWSRKNVL